MSTAAASSAGIAEAIETLNLALRTHGGSVECVGVENGTLSLRMTGLCAACLFKPVTLEATIRPYIRERLAMDVVIEGARISDEAQARLRRALQSSYDPPAGSADLESVATSKNFSQTRRR